MYIPSTERPSSSSLICYELSKCLKPFFLLMEQQYSYDITTIYKIWQGLVLLFENSLYKISLDTENKTKAGQAAGVICGHKTR